MGASVQSHYFVEESDKIVSNDVVLVYGIVEMYSNSSSCDVSSLPLHPPYTPNASSMASWMIQNLMISAIK